MKRALLLSLLCATILAMPLTATAGRLLVIVDDTNELYELDLTNQIAWLVAYLDAEVSYSGLDYDTSTGTIWVSDVYYCTPGYGLAMINILTGEVLPAGTHLLGGHTSINVMGLAYDSANDVLWGADFDSGGLVWLVRKQEDDYLTPPETCGGPDEYWPWVGNAVGVGPFGGPDIRGLAYNSTTDTLYGVDDTYLYTVDRGSGAATLVGAHGIGTGPAYIGLTYDADVDVMYAVGGDNGNLYTINMTTGASTLLFDTGLSTMSGLASVPDFDGNLYVSEDDSNSIWTVDPDTGAATMVGPVGSGLDLDLTGMAFTADTSEVLIYGVVADTPGHMLGSVNPTTGAVTVVGQPNANEFPIAGLAYDPVWAAPTNVLWGVDTLRNITVLVNRTSGNTIFHGCLDQVLPPGDPLGCTDSSLTNYGIKGVAYNRRADKLYGVSDTTLYQIHRDTVYDFGTGTNVCFLAGMAEEIGPLNIGGAATHIGLEWDPATGVMYGVSSADGMLYQINQLKGQATPVGPTNLTEPSGLAMGEGGVLFSSSFEAGSPAGWTLATQ